MTNRLKRQTAPKPQAIQHTQAIINSQAIQKQAEANALQAMQQQQQPAPAPESDGLIPSVTGGNGGAGVAHQGDVYIEPPAPVYEVPQAPVVPDFTTQQSTPPVVAPIAPPASSPSQPSEVAAMLAQMKAQQDQINNLTKMIAAGTAAPAQPQQRPIFNPTGNPMLKPATAKPPAGPKDQIDPATGQFKDIEQLMAENQMPLPVPVQLNTPPQAVQPVAPASWRDYQMQNNPYLAHQYPEVTDIFQNRVPGEAPIHGVPQYVQPPEPVQQRVIHESRWVEPELSLAYRVTSDFAVHLGDVLVEFNRGEVIYDTTVLDTLMRGDCKYIIPIHGSENFICCPQCTHRFPYVAARE